jgi:hypothetical protein
MIVDYHLRQRFDGSRERNKITLCNMDTETYPPPVIISYCVKEYSL